MGDQAGERFEDGRIEESNRFRVHTVRGWAENVAPVTMKNDLCRKTLVSECRCAQPCRSPIALLAWEKRKKETNKDEDKIQEFLTKHQVSVLSTIQLNKLHA
jgi:hypothetical protein